MRSHYNYHNLSTSIKFLTFSLILGLVVSVSVFSIIPIFASALANPYNPGVTLDPDCLPGDLNCTVSSLWTISGTNVILDQSGNVGIGTTTPSYKFTTVGDSYFQGNITTTGTLSASNFTGTNTGDITLSSATGLSLVGQALSITSGYVIPTSASTTNWNNIYNSVSASSTYWDTAYSWGNHASAGYLTSYSESDPLFTAASSSLLSTTTASLTYQPLGSYLSSESDPLFMSASSTYLSTTSASSTYLTIATASSTYYLASNPNGYLSSFSELDPVYTASSWSTTTNNSANWNSAFGWGNHANAGYLTSAIASSTYAPLAGAIFTGDISAPNFSGTSTGTNTGDVTLTNNINGLTISGQALTLGLAGASATGSLSSADWNTFNSKLSSYAETDPIWLAASSSYLLTVDATSTYAPLTNILALDNVTAFTPTGNYNPATKKYVDDQIAGLSLSTTSSSGGLSLTTIIASGTAAVGNLYTNLGATDNYTMTLPAGSSDGSTIGFLNLTGVGGIDSDTKLMLHADGTDNGTTFTDSSASANVMTPTGAVTKIGTKEFGTASAYFDGSSYISTPDSANWNFGSGDFSIDLWANYTSTGNKTFLSQKNDSSNLWQFYTQGSILVFYSVGGSALVDIEATFTPTTGVWYHIAVVRSGGIIKLYVNGVSQTLTTNTNSSATLPDLTSNVEVGRAVGVAYNFTGYMDEIRLSKGIARWTSNFTPPTSEYTTAGGSIIVTPDAGESIYPYTNGTSVALDAEGEKLSLIKSNGKWYDAAFGIGGGTTASSSLSIPSLSGNVGKYLTNDGNTLSWATVVGGGGSGGLTITDITASGTAAVGNLYVNTSTTTSYVMNLPTSTADGSVIGFMNTSEGSGPYASQYPPAYSNTYVYGSNVYSSDSYGAGYHAFNPGLSLTGAASGNEYFIVAASSNNLLQVDLGEAKTITRFYYENSHESGSATNRGAKNFTLWGSNSAGAFADHNYATDTDWVPLTTEVNVFAEHVALNQSDPHYVLVTNATAYRYYRFKIADGYNSASQYTGLRRVELQSGGTVPVTITPAYTESIYPYATGTSIILSNQGAKLSLVKYNGRWYDAAFGTGGSGLSLPSQTGNVGKYLTTDGTNLSWANVSGVSATSSGLTLTNVTASGTAILGNLYTNVGATDNITMSLPASSPDGSTVGFLNVSGSGSYTNQYPPAQSSTYVKATTELNASYLAYKATDPAKSLVGGEADNSWYASNIVNQRFHIDLGSAKLITRIYYENQHSSGGSPTTGAKNFTFWGSNSATAFTELTYGIDTNWTQIPTETSQFEQHVALNTTDPKYILATNATPYRYYAFKFADNWGHGSYMGVRRISLQTGGAQYMIIDPDSAESIYPYSNGVAVDLTAQGSKLSLIKSNGKWYDAAFGIGGGSTASTTITSATTFAVGTTTSLATLTVSGNTYISDVLNVASTTGVSSILGKLSIGTSTSLATLTVAGDLSLSGKIYDTNYSAGTAGMVLQSTGTSTRWVSTSSLGISGGSSVPELVTVTSAGTTTIDSTYSGKLITNAGAASDIILQLPSIASVGNDFEISIVNEVESYPKEAYLKSVYHFNSGALTTDSKGTNTLTNDGGVEESSSGINGYAASTSEGKNFSIASVPTDFDFGGTTQFALSMWVKLADFSSIQGLFSTYPGTGSRQHKISVGTDGRVTWGYGTDGNVALTSSGSMTANTWTNIVVVRDTVGYKLYINGSLGASVSSTFSTAAPSAKWTLGRYYSDGEPPPLYQMKTGFMDEVLVWKGASLTSTEVSDLYNSGTGEFYTGSKNITIVPDSSDTLPGTVVAGSSIKSALKGDYTKLRSTDTGWIAESVVSSSDWVNSSDSTAWNPSSRSVKENFTQLDKQDILNKISSLDMTQWNYIAQDDGIKHIGPIAEDFYALFGLGGTDKAISTIDPAGIALVGIQALNKNLQYIFGTTSIESLANSTTTLETYTVTDLFAGMVKSALNKLSSIFVEEINTNKINLGSTEKPSGLTIYDKTTKQPFCMMVDNGSVVTTAGVCTDTVEASTEVYTPIVSEEEEAATPTETTDTSTTESTATTTDPLPEDTTSSASEVTEDTATTTEPTVEPEATSTEPVTETPAETPVNEPTPEPVVETPPAEPAPVVEPAPEPVVETPPVVEPTPEPEPEPAPEPAPAETPAI
ncbi:MAG: LamG-like jellyroll fold domain-containing protein [Minisyncoccia bacterium]